MPGFDRLSFPEVHVHAAWEARIEAAYGAHDVDALNVVARALLEDRHVLDRVLVWPGRPVDVARARVPRRRRIRVVVRDLPIANDEMVRQHAADRLRETAADPFLRDGERLPGLRMAEANLLERLIDEVHRAGRRICL